MASHKAGKDLPEANEPKLASVWLCRLCTRSFFHATDSTVCANPMQPLLYMHPVGYTTCMKKFDALKTRTRRAKALLESRIVRKVATGKGEKDRCPVSGAYTYREVEENPET